MKQNKEKSISSGSLEIINHYKDKNNKILDLRVKNKWLEATLSSGVKFKVLNI